MMWLKPWAFHEKLPSISIPTGIRNCIFPPCTLSEEASYWAYLPSVMDQIRGMLLVENQGTEILLMFEHFKPINKTFNPRFSKTLVLVKSKV